jgi:hypothetical protein
MFSAVRLAGFVALSLASLAAAEDYLISSRALNAHSKRGLDAAGNYNICMSCTIDITHNSY